jgi:hypothetical protein
MANDATIAADSFMGKTGAWLSLACAVHCAVEPIVLPLLPLAGIALPFGETVEHGLIGLAIALALWNFSRGFRVHKRGALFLVLFLALAFIGSGFVLAEVTGNHDWEMGFVILGTLTLASGQFWNRHLHRNCVDCCQEQG